MLDQVPGGLRHASFLRRRGDVQPPAQEGKVRRVVVSLDHVPLAGLVVVDIGRAGQDAEPDLVLHDGLVGSVDVGADVRPPVRHAASAGEEITERLEQVGVLLIGRGRRNRVYHVLQGAHERRAVDLRDHRLRVEEEGGIIRMLGIGAGPTEVEVRPDSAGTRQGIENAVQRQPVGVGLAFEELRVGLHLLPGLRHAELPFAIG